MPRSGEIRQFPRIHSRHSQIGVLRVEEITDFATAMLFSGPDELTRMQRSDKVAPIKRECALSAKRAHS